MYRIKNIIFTFVICHIPDRKPNVKPLIFTVTNISGGVQFVNNRTWCDSCLLAPRPHRFTSSMLQMQFVLSRTIPCTRSNIQVWNHCSPVAASINCLHSFLANLKAYYERLKDTRSSNRTIILIKHAYSMGVVAVYDLGWSKALCAMVTYFEWTLSTSPLPLVSLLLEISCCLYFPLSSAFVQRFHYHV